MILIRKQKRDRCTIQVTGTVVDKQLIVTEHRHRDEDGHYHRSKTSKWKTTIEYTVNGQTVQSVWDTGDALPAGILDILKANRKSISEVDMNTGDKIAILVNPNDINEFFVIGESIVTCNALFVILFSLFAFTIVFFSEILPEIQYRLG